jgi:hypothetical protein
MLTTKNDSTKASRKRTVILFSTAAALSLAATLATPALATMINTIGWQTCVHSGTSYNCYVKGGMDPNGLKVPDQISVAYFDFTSLNTSVYTRLMILKASASGTTTSDYVTYHYPPAGLTYPAFIEIPVYPSNVKTNASTYDYLWTRFDNVQNATPIGVATVDSY